MFHEIAAHTTSEYNRILREEGKVAADEFSAKSGAQAIKSMSGATKGALVGTMIMPGLGTVFGGVIGFFRGLTSESDDKTIADNVRTALGESVGVASSVAGHINRTS